MFRREQGPESAPYLRCIWADKLTLWAADGVWVTLVDFLQSRFCVCAPSESQSGVVPYLRGTVVRCHSIIPFEAGVAQR